MVSKRSGFHPGPKVDTAGSGVLSQAGAVLLTETIAVSGLGAALRVALAPWMSCRAIHHPAKIVVDLAVTLALGGDCLADIALLRAEPAVFGLVASDPTVSRTIDVLAADADRVLKAIDAARAAARAVVWARSGKAAPNLNVDADRPLIVDLDATLITAHSDKEGARPTFKRGYGTHPLCAFVDHGPDGTGEPLAVLLRPGNAGSNTASDHITVVKAPFSGGQQLNRSPRGMHASWLMGVVVVMSASAGGGFSLGGIPLLVLVFLPMVVAAYRRDRLSFPMVFGCLFLPAWPWAMYKAASNKSRDRDAHPIKHGAPAIHRPAALADAIDR